MRSKSWGNNVRAVSSGHEHGTPWGIDGRKRGEMSEMSYETLFPRGLFAHEASQPSKRCSHLARLCWSSGPLVCSSRGQGLAQSCFASGVTRYLVDGMGNVAREWQRRGYVMKFPENNAKKKNERKISSSETSDTGSLMTIIVIGKYTIGGAKPFRTL